MSKAERILSLDIGASSIKLAEFQRGRGGGMELLRYAHRSLGLDPQHEAERSRYVITTLRELLQELQIKPAPVVVSVSGQSVFSRFVKLPPVEPDKVSQIVQYEAQQNVPFPIEEVVWDYQLVGGMEGEVDVMLAAIKGEIIDELTDCVAFAGLKPEIIDVAPMALYNAVRYNYGEQEGCTLIVDMGARATDLIFIEAGRVFSRSIPMAGNAITQQIVREFDLSFEDAEEMKIAHGFVGLGGAYEGHASETADKVSKTIRSVMTRMHAEINRSINFYRSQQSGSAPQRVLLTGGTSIIPYTDSFLREKLKVEVEYLNPFQNVMVSEGISAEEIGQDAHLLGEIVGLALRKVHTCPIEINLMPAKVIAEKAFEKKQPVLLMAMFGLVLVLAVWCAYYWRMSALGEERFVEKDRHVNQLKSLKAQIDRPNASIEDLASDLQVLEEVVNSQSHWQAVLEQVYDALPPGIWITRIEVPEEDQAGSKTLMDDVPSRFGSRFGGPMSPDQPEEEEGAGLIDTIRIGGLGYLDMVESPEVIVGFTEELKSRTDFFTEKTRIATQPRPAPGAVVREFTIELALKTPIAL